MSTEHYYCADCAWSFYAADDEDVEVECPCCGSMEVQP